MVNDVYALPQNQNWICTNRKLDYYHVKTEEGIRQKYGPDVIEDVLILLKNVVNDEKDLESNMYRKMQGTITAELPKVIHNKIKVKNYGTVKEMKEKLA